MLKMYEDKEQWNSDDIVLFSVVTPLRYIPADNIKSMDHQVHWLPDKAAKIMYKWGPHNICFNLQTHGYMTMSKVMHQNMYTLQTVSDDISVNGFTPKFDIEISFAKYVEENFATDNYRYPGGHLHEDCHVAYANYLHEAIWKN